MMLGGIHVNVKCIKGTGRFGWCTRRFRAPLKHGAACTCLLDITAPCGQQFSNYTSIPSPGTKASRRKPGTETHFITNPVDMEPALKVIHGSTRRV